MITIRKATENDLDILERFEQGIVETERPFDSTLKDGMIHYYDLREFMHSADATLLVAEDDGRIVASGYAQIREAKNYLKHDRYAYLGFMFVEPAFRGKGLNRLILDELISWSRSRHITEVRLDVYAGNDIAKKAYEKAGFEMLLVEMRRSV